MPLLSGRPFEFRISSVLFGAHLSSGDHARMAPVRQGKGSLRISDLFDLCIVATMLEPEHDLDAI